MCSQEYENLVIENRRLVYFIAGKFCGQGIEYEDLCSIGMIGLIKAAKTFDKMREIKFSSYAGKCISNEILIEFRKVRRRQGENITLLSLEQSIYGQEDNTLNLKDCIEDERVDIANAVEEINMAAHAITVLLNSKISRKKVICFLLNLSGMQYEEMRKILVCSQSYISKILILCRDIMRREADTCDDEKKWKMYFSTTEYVLTLESTVIKRISRGLIKLIENDSKKFDFTITKTRGEIRMVFPKSVKAFLFIAQLLNEIERCGLKFFDEST